MELEMQWDGNPSIVLDIKTYLGVALPVQVNFYSLSHRQTHTHTHLLVCIFVFLSVSRSVSHH